MVAVCSVNLQQCGVDVLAKKKTMEDSRMLLRCSCCEVCLKQYVVGCRRTVMSQRGPSASQADARAKLMRARARRVRSTAKAATISRAHCGTGATGLRTTVYVLPAGRAMVGVTVAAAAVTVPVGVAVGWAAVGAAAPERGLPIVKITSSSPSS